MIDHTGIFFWKLLQWLSCIPLETFETGWNRIRTDIIVYFTVFENWKVAMNVVCIVE